MNYSDKIATKASAEWVRNANLRAAFNNDVSGFATCMNTIAKGDSTGGVLALEVVTVWGNDAGLRAEFNGDINTYASYRKAVAAGRVAG